MNTCTTRSALVAIAISCIAACASQPMTHSGGELIASPGVKKLFVENPDAEAIVADGSTVKCRQHQRVGSHIHTRTCMTVQEWADRERAMEKEKMRLMVGPCAAGPHIGVGSCGGDG